MQNNYDVIIAGGGPTGVALGIELGLNNIKTLILEKHETPLLSPRAQSLNARTMEFFMRWGIADELRQRSLLPADYPMQGVWCSSLNGKTYAASGAASQLNDDISPQRDIRIPLWITEDVLRARLKNFPSITFIKQHQVIDVQLDSNKVIVTAKDNLGQMQQFSSVYCVGCDGANSIVRQKANIEFEKLSPQQRVLNILFETTELDKRVTVEKGFIYFLLETKKPAALGPIDLKRGLWYAQIRARDLPEKIGEIDLEILLNEMTGVVFSKKIVQAHFWNMQIELAKTFAKNNKIFLAGDSAHGFMPTGGFGLNTAFGDIVNLGWKLAAVIQNRSDASLLATYEQERLPICLRNLKAAQKNADDAMNLQKKYNPTNDPEGFAQANSALAKQHTHSLGISMGYAYFDSPLTHLQKNQSIEPMEQSKYQPTVAPGYFLPHRWLEKNQCIYSLLSPSDWTLIVSGKEDAECIKKIKEKNPLLSFKILNVPENIYSARCILIRPDWHISEIA